MDIDDQVRSALIQRYWPLIQDVLHGYYRYHVGERGEVGYSAVEVPLCELGRALIKELGFPEPKFVAEFQDITVDHREVNTDALGEDLRWQVFERDNFTCQKCQSRRRLTVDHIIPRSKGGSNDLTNLTTLCRSCNSGKRDR